MNPRKISSVLILSLVMVLLFQMTALAGISNNKPTPGNPPPGKENPIGTLDADSVTIQPKFVADWRTVVDSITNTYNGYRWRGWMVSGGPGGTVSLSNSYGVSNGYNANIGVEVDGVSAGVGFDVTYSTNVTASYSHDVSSGKYGWIGLDDWYHVKEFTCHTTYYNNWGIPLETEYGTGWAEQWYMWGYQYGESNSMYSQPPNPHN